MAQLSRVRRTSRTIRFFVLVALLGTVTQFALPPNRVQTRLFGASRLVSVEPLPEAAGELCFETQDAASSAAPARPTDAVRQDVARRRPTATIKDPRNTLAGLALDTTRNEVVFAEENNFSVLVYDRMTNTPPKAALSEPKRVIQGDNTFLEYACGVYVDPGSGDIYAINNDTLTWMTVFSRDAKGNVSPNRKLAIPFSSFAVVADE